MGYELHITRADEWFNSDDCPITAEEWLATVGIDPELQLAAENGPYFAVWSGRRFNLEASWFDWDQGRISTKHPDRAVLAKMLELARWFKANVQGDHGERYSTTEDLQASP